MQDSQNRQQIIVIVGTSSYDCAEHRTNMQTDGVVKYLYDERDISKMMGYGHDCRVVYTELFKQKPDKALLDFSRSLTRREPGLQLFGYLGVWYPVDSVNCITITSVSALKVDTLEFNLWLSYGFCVRVHAKITLVDQKHGVYHVLEGSIADVH